MAAKAAKDWSLPRFWVSIGSYKKQPVQKVWGSILNFAWVKFEVASHPCAPFNLPSTHPLFLGSDGPAGQFESMDDENAEIFNIYMVKNCASPGLKLLLSLYE